MIIIIGVPTGIRTRVASVKGRCPRPLDDGDLRFYCFVTSATFYYNLLLNLKLIFNYFGGGKRDRTADLLHAMQALSQLSYTPVPTSFRFQSIASSARRHIKDGRRACQ